MLDFFNILSIFTLTLKTKKFNINLEKKMKNKYKDKKIT